MAITWTLILNPHASSGKGAAVQPRLEALLKSQGVYYRLLRSEYPGHAQELALSALRKGARHFAAVGGDGTVNEVANGLLNQSAVPVADILFTQIPIGTGNDWRRTIGIPTDLNRCVAMLKAHSVITQDIGHVSCQQHGEEQSRFFLNIGGIGFEAAAGLVANDRKAQGKGGIMGYVGALLGTLRSYRAIPVRSVRLDTRDLGTRTVYTAAIGICRYNGGGMKQCPQAVIDDGLLDLTLVNQLSTLRVLRNLPRLFTGTFVKDRAVEQHRTALVEVDGPKELLVEVDGENIGHAPAVFRVVEGRLRVARPQG
jgi:YegS/Rv2252/BmrU family lipid kinase